MASSALARCSVRQLAILGLACLLCSMHAANAQSCSGERKHMSCNVPGFCRRYVGAFPFVGDASDCTCVALCNEARRQGQGGSCTVNPGAVPGEHWISATFNRYDGNNEWRGTVFCDPKGGGGNSR